MTLFFPIYQVSFFFFFLVAMKEWATVKINSAVFLLHASAAGVSLWDGVVAVCIHGGVALRGKDSQ